MRLFNATVLDKPVQREGKFGSFLYCPVELDNGFEVSLTCSNCNDQEFLALNPGEQIKIAQYRNGTGPLRVQRVKTHA